MKKIIRAATVPQTLNRFCKGVLRELSQEYEVVALSSPGPFMDVLREREGVRTIEVPMERHISIRKDLKSLVSLVKVFKAEKPDMVHSMTPKAGLLCMAAAWWTKVPVRVHTFTGLVFPTSTGLKKRVLMLTDWITCKCATHIIPEGEGVKNDLLNNHITNKPISVLGYGNVRGIDLDYYDRTPEVEEKANLIRDPQKFSYVVVGRKAGDKGFNELIAAFKRLYSEFPQVRLFLVGASEDNLDPIGDEAKEAIDTYDAIHSIDHLEGSDFLAYYAASDCYVSASYREGFPNTVLEAGAMGLPCVVTDINGSREIITDGFNGLIVPPHNADALYKAMREMIVNPSMRTQMASVSRGRIAERYEQSFVRKCLYDFYHSIL